MTKTFLEWYRAIKSIAQNGLAYSENPFDLERYEQIATLTDQMLSSNLDIPADELSHIFKCEKGYATPKVDVRGAVFREDRILLVREISDELWTLPGGWADVNDSPSESVVREIEEESGYKTECIRLVALFDRNKHDHPPMLFHVYKLFFLCELIGGSARTSYETGEVDFFAENEIPPLSTARVTKAQIATVFNHYRNRDLPTEFD